MRQRGSITVFFSIVFLCIILIVVTVIDGALLYVGHTQTKRAVSSASYSLLTEYYTPLKEDYGLFGYDMNEATDDKALDYVKSQLKPYDIVDFKDGHWSLNNYLITDVDTEHYDQLIIPNVTEAQILEYMKYRAPVSAIEPFLLKLEMINKVAKTSKVVKEKNEKVDKKAADIDNSYQELIKHVEGIYEGAVTDEYFVKMLITNQESYKTNIPDKSIVNTLKTKLKYHSQVMNLVNGLPIIHEKVRNIMSYESQLKETIDVLAEYNKRVAPIVEIYNKISKKNDAIKKKQSTIDKKQDELEKATEVYEKKLIQSVINYLKKEKIELEDELTELEINLENEKNNYYIKYSETYDYAVKMIGLLTDNINLLEIQIDSLNNELITSYGLSDHSNYEDVLEYQQTQIDDYKIVYENLLTANSNTINAINTIKNESSDIKSSIDEINNDIDNNKEDYDERTTDSLREDMEELSKSLYDPNKDDGTSEDSLVRIEKIANNNIQYLSEFNSQLNNIGSIKDFIINNEKDSSVDAKYDILIESCNNLNNEYSAMINFKYGEMKEKDDTDIKEQMNEEIDKSKDVEIIETKYNTLDESIIDNLPSSMMEELVANEELNIDDDAAFTSSFFDNLMKFDIVAIGEDVRNNIYINEYVLDVFDDYVEYNKTKEEKQYLNHQVEYVIGGSFDDSINCKIVESEIMLIRSGLNFLHIMTDKTKKTQVKGLAVAMASWWSGGLATFIFELLIIGAWSIAESYIDLYQLKKGNEVAFFKSQTDWVLEIENLFTFAIEKLGEIVINETTKAIDKIAESTKELGDELLTRVDNVTTENVDLFLENATEAMSDMAKQGLDEIDYQVDRVIKETTEAVLNDETMPSCDYLDEEVVTAIQTAVLEKEDKIKKQGYGAIDTVTSYALEESKEYVNNKKDEIINMVQGKMDEVIDKVSDKVKDKATETITNVIENSKSKFSMDLTDISKESKSDLSKKKTSIFSSFKLSYQDYLRLLLFIQNKEKKIHRIQNLIQLDIIEKYDEDFMYSDYATGITVSGTVYKKYILLDKISGLIDDDLIIYNTEASSHY